MFGSSSCGGISHGIKSIFRLDAITYSTVTKISHLYLIVDIFSENHRMLKSGAPYFDYRSSSSCTWILRCI